jgi:hypothetical protein
MLAEAPVSSVSMGKSGFDTDLNHCSNRRKQSVRRRFARRGRRRLEISRLGLELGLSFRFSFHHQQHRVAQTLYRMRERALARQA